jgi:hypothetical protein
MEQDRPPNQYQNRLIEVATELPREWTDGGRPISMAPGDHGMAAARGKRCT